MSGTSVAAPHVTGAIALVMSRMERLGRPQPNALYYQSRLRATARSNGIYHTGFGSGVLDVEAFLADAVP
jgi:subtilisin family serine protease|nr:S8 family serine peptidase [Neorhizobium tomejilense]